MRHQSTVTSLSWIPSEAIPGLTRLAFDAGVTHYDQPPPECAADLAALRASDRYRFANRLVAWIDVDEGRITGSGYGAESGGTMGSTTVRLGRLHATFRALALADIRHVPTVGDGWVRFVQTTGGRTGLPAPRIVRRPPFVQWQAPLVWTTLALTLHADGRSEWEVVGASPFPRHWIYGPDHTIHSKVATTRYRRWWRGSFGAFSPWGAEDSPALVTAAESALERQLSTQILHGSRRPRVIDVPARTVLAEQDADDDHLMLLLDGVVRVSVDGRRVARLGPGAVLGERAGLEDGQRTATVTTTTRCRIVVAEPRSLSTNQLAELARSHHRESEL